MGKLSSVEYYSPFSGHSLSQIGWERPVPAASREQSCILHSAADNLKVALGISQPPYGFLFSLHKGTVALTSL